MVDNKKKGIRWERELAKALSKHAKVSKRIPGSGALGSTLVDPRLTGDVFVRYSFLPRPLKIEAKFGYGGSSQMTIKREWMEKVCKEAEANNSLPIVALKFRGVTSGDKTSKWLCITLEDWNTFVGYLNELFSECDDYWKQKYETNKGTLDG